jgi:hypothetical protein
LGAAGKDAEIAAINQIALDMQAIVEVQGGAQGPIVFLKNVYKLATDKAKKLGSRPRRNTTPTRVSRNAGNPRQGPRRTSRASIPHARQRLSGA